MRRELPLPRMLPIHSPGVFRGRSEGEDDSHSSSSNSPARADYEDGEFFASTNDSQSSIGVPAFEDMAVSEEACVQPISHLPAEVLISIFAKLSDSRDLLSCMLVSKRWARNSVDLLWHRPACTTWPKHSSICHTLANTNPYFAYRDFIKRLNLAALADRVNDGSVAPLAVCTRVERLTLTSCEGLTDSGLNGLVTGSSHLLALDVSQCGQITDGAMNVLADNCPKLQGLNVSGCRKITNASMIRVAQNCRFIKRVCQHVVRLDCLSAC